MNLEKLHANIEDQNPREDGYTARVFHAKLTADIAIKFCEYIENDAWIIEYQDQKEYSSEQLFNYFINNVYKP